MKLTHLQVQLLPHPEVSGWDDVLISTVQVSRELAPACPGPSELTPLIDHLRGKLSLSFDNV